MIQKGIRGELPGQKITSTHTNAELSFKKDKPEEKLTLYGRLGEDHRLEAKG
jgi:hypothetical protein